MLLQSCGVLAIESMSMVESFSERCWLVSWGAIRCEHCCDDIQRGTTCEFARFFHVVPHGIGEDSVDCRDNGGFPRFLE